MTQFWWVRHGPTHRDGLIGWTDAPADLSDSAALKRLNAYLPKDALVVSSDLIRSVHTADALSDGRERLAHDADLREFHFGDWENRTFTDIAESHPELSRAYWESPGDIAPPNGESWNSGAERVARSVKRLSETHRGRDIIVIAHFGVILTQLQKATQMPATSVLGFKIDNLSVTTLQDMGQAWRVLGVNHNP